MRTPNVIDSNTDEHPVGTFLNDIALPAPQEVPRRIAVMTSIQECQPQLWVAGVQQMADETDKTASKRGVTPESFSVRDTVTDEHKSLLSGKNHAYSRVELFGFHRSETGC